MKLKYLRTEKFKHSFQISNFKFQILFVFILSTFCFLLATNVAAETMKNDWYILQMGNLNSIAGKPTGPNYSVSYTVGQTGPGLYSGANFKVRAGFQYIYSIIPFSFTISQIEINFGNLSPTNPVLRTATLSVNNQSAGGYSVKAFENHQLNIPSSGAIIPDTTCDGGSCSESSSGAWTSTLTYGFGYRCDQVDATNYCASGFTSSDNYKQFGDNSLSESAQIVMSGASGRTQRSQITYKVNISATQTAGLYSNNITYIATPTY